VLAKEIQELKMQLERIFKKWKFNLKIQIYTTTKTKLN